MREFEVQKYCKIFTLRILRTERTNFCPDENNLVYGSVNDAIDVDSCHMRCASVTDTAHIIQKLEVGTQLAKLDLHNAYRMVPVHPDDHCLLGMHWSWDVYTDTALPFGLRLTPQIFSSV